MEPEQAMKVPPQPEGYESEGEPLLLFEDKETGRIKQAQQKMKVIPSDDGPNASDKDSENEEVEKEIASEEGAKKESAFEEEFEKDDVHEDHVEVEVLEAGDNPEDVDDEVTNEDSEDENNSEFGGPESFGENESDIEYQREMRFGCCRRIGF
ncbi:hypothetical protein R1sor_014788 [Riccia sorocarpa]|uniref:Uncharacterized protein n=1 Tax=Riccia sorocarpa TaxID=122646 RepID=A0ABD3HE90_9MARC